MEIKYGDFCVHTRAFVDENADHCVLDWKSWRSDMFEAACAHCEPEKTWETHPKMSRHITLLRRDRGKGATIDNFLKAIGMFHLTHKVAYMEVSVERVALCDTAGVDQSAGACEDIF